MHGDHLDERQDRADKATGTGVCGDQMRGEGWQPARTSFDAVAWHLITTALGGARGTNQPGKKSELLDRVSNLRLRRLDHDSNGRLGRHRMIHECGPTCPRRFVVCGQKAVRINLLVGKLSLAGELGFEPRQTESESVVLPLHHSPILPNYINILSRCLGNRLERDRGNHRFRSCVFYSFGPGLGKHGRRRNFGRKIWLGLSPLAR